MQDRFAEGGVQPTKPQRYAPIFVAASLTGLYSQRNNFHDPSNIVTQRFYGGRPDTLWNGVNVELSNELTMIRRFGTVGVSKNYAQPPDNAFQWELNDGTIMLLIDTASAVYNEPLSGATPATIFTKTAGAGRGYFVASGNVLYYGDGIDTIKYTPLNPNGLTWNWGIAAPALAPSVTSIATGSSATAWAANTVFSTMGLIVDPNGNAQQLSGVNANPASPNTTQIGTSGNGSPNFNTAYLATTTDNTITWTSLGRMTLWAPNTVYQPGNAIFDPGTNCIFIASHSHAVTSGTTRPLFNTTLGLSGARISEPTGARWENIGFVGQAAGCVRTWTKNTTFALYQIQANGQGDPTNANSAIVWPLIPFISANGQLCNGQPTYLLGATAGTTANAVTTPWNGIPSQTLGQITLDNQLAWTCLGSATWAATTGYTAWVLGNATFSVVEDQNSNLQVCIGSGVSNILKPGSTAVLTAASNASGGNTTYTGTFPTPFPVNYLATITGFVNAGNNATGLIISSTATTLVIANPNGVAETHAGSAQFNPWSTNYGGQTVDGSVTWVCVGNSLSWTAATQWFLPAQGFQPPLASQAFGGAEVIGSGFVQAVIASGLSGGSAPSWSVTVGGTTTDNAITWETVAPFSAVGIAWTKGHVYAFSFQCRTPIDPYDTSALLTFGGLNTPAQLLPLGNVPGLTTPLGAPTGGETGAISSTSPVFTISGPNSGSVNVITGLGSTDSQVDTIIIWRDADGGGPSNMFDLIHIPAPKPIAGVAQPWMFRDFLPDTAQTVSGINYPGLDVLVPAPIDGQNNPPPTGFLPLSDELHFSRIWGAVGNTVFHSSGPDNIIGNGNESFNPADDDFPFKSTVIACIHTPAGLLCPTSTDWECIYGGPSTASFFSMTMARGVGLLTYTAWDRVGGEIYFVSPDCQLWSINPTVQMARSGFPIGNLLAQMLPANGPNVAVAAHENGTDNAVYVSDGATGWFRLNPHQVGADTAGENAQCWSPFAEIATGGGAALLKSVLTPGLPANAAPLRQLLICPAVGGFPILARNLGTFLDNGTSYDAWFDIGSVTLTFPGQRAAVKFLEFDFMPQPSTAGVNLPTFNNISQTITVSNGVSALIASFSADGPIRAAQQHTIVQTGNGGTFPAPEITLTLPGVQNHSAIVVSLGLLNTDNPTDFNSNISVTDTQGNTYTLLTSQANSISQAQQWIAENVSGGTLTVTVKVGTAVPTAGVGSPSSWNSGTAYVPGNVVAIFGYWICAVANTNQSPSSSAVYWSPVLDMFATATEYANGGSGALTTLGTNQNQSGGPSVPNINTGSVSVAGLNQYGFVVSMIWNEGGGTHANVFTPSSGWTQRSFASNPTDTPIRGQFAGESFATFDAVQNFCTPSNPSVYYALDDPRPTPTWIQLANFVWDPPVKYGPPVAAGGAGPDPPYLPERFYLNQNADVAIGRRIRVKVDYGSNPCNERDELISWAVFGKKYVEE